MDRQDAHFAVCYLINMDTIIVIILAVIVLVGANNETSLGNVPKFPNIGFLGRGYDLLRANPRPLFQPVDAGFVSSIFDMSSYKLGRLAADGRRAVPDYGDVIECTACQLSFESSVISGPKSYIESLMSQIRFETSEQLLDATAYRASEAYRRVVDETLTRKRILIDTAAYCVVYCAELRQPLKPAVLDAAFIEAVRQLPIISTSNSTNSSTSSFKKQAYFAFLQRFGTHFVSSMRAGSLFWQRATFSQANFSRLEQDVMSVGLETAAGLAFLTSTLAYQSQQEMEIGEKFRKSASSIILYSFGALPSTKQGIYNTTSRWLQESKETPMPVEIRLTPVTSLFTNDTFPDDISSKLAVFQEILSANSYCEYLANFNRKTDCGTNVTSGDLLGPKMPQIVSNFGGTYFKAGSSGIRDIPNQLTDIFDCPNGYVPILIGGGTYAVDSWPGGNCYPDGSSVPINQQIVVRPTLPGHFYFCRNGTSDPQNAFFGFFSVVNAMSYGPFAHWQCNNESTCCGGLCRRPSSTGRDCRSPASRGQNDVLIAFYGCEYIYASYSRTPNAYIGGFYLIDLLRPTHSWINPTTGVTSCPAGYTPQLLFSQTNTNASDNIYPFESYVCLMESAV